MGNKIIIINPGTGGKKEIENNDIVQTIQPINMDDILVSLKSSIDNTTVITSNLSKITDNVQSGKGTLGRLLTDKSLGKTFDSTFVNLKESTAGLRMIVEKAKSSWLLWGF
jgi:phospholipid/cholesterol/gamma-HCH transport system substrate-binding protein